MVIPHVKMNVALLCQATEKYNSIALVSLSFPSKHQKSKIWTMKFKF